VVVLIDYPGFNLRLACALRAELPRLGHEVTVCPDGQSSPSTPARTDRKPTDGGCSRASGETQFSGGGGRA